MAASVPLPTQNAYIGVGFLFIFCTLSFSCPVDFDSNTNFNILKVKSTLLYLLSLESDMLLVK